MPRREPVAPPPWERAARRVRARTDLSPPTAPGTVLTAGEVAGPVLAVAPRLLGLVLVARSPAGRTVGAVVTEVEAYDGTGDAACHASRGRTARTEVMFGPPGHWYVYLCYGVHWLANLVCGPEGYPAAVLLRAAGPWRGPGVLTAALGVGRAFHGAAATPETGLWLEDRGLRPPAAEVAATARIGVAAAGDEASAKPWRWVWRGRAGPSGGED